MSQGPSLHTGEQVWGAAVHAPLDVEDVVDVLVVPDVEWLDSPVAVPDVLGVLDVTPDVPTLLLWSLRLAPSG
jgi:hypothetical protein